ncbi:MAG: hypothetical protein GXO16_05800 [Epsilonproteobacteria bacterium]|nr:hypothetical protein [Campylobacterota bacterium]
MEREIKEALFWWLEKRYKNKVITTVALKANGSCNIADIVMASRDLYAFEIKGPNDTLRRLPAQIDAYTRLFDYVYVVYWRGKFEIEDKRVGLIEVYNKR